MRKVVLAGLMAWTLALVVAVVLLILDVKTWSVVAICAAGIALGGLGLAWLRRNGRPQDDVAADERHQA